MSRKYKIADQEYPYFSTLAKKIRLLLENKEGIGESRTDEKVNSFSDL